MLFKSVYLFGNQRNAQTKIRKSQISLILGVKENFIYATLTGESKNTQNISYFTPISVAVTQRLNSP